MRRKGLMSKEEKLLEEFEDAVRELAQDEAYGYADPNRESADYARSKVEKLRKKLLKKLQGESK